MRKIKQGGGQSSQLDIDITFMKSYVRGKKKQLYYQKIQTLTGHWTVQHITIWIGKEKRWVEKKEKGKRKNELHQNQELIKE